MKIEYEIEINEQGRPYISLKENTLEIEENFFAYEIVRYSLSDILAKNTNLPEDVVNSLKNAGGVIQELSDKIAKMIVDRNNAIDDLMDEKSDDDELKSDD